MSQELVRRIESAIAWLEDSANAHVSAGKLGFAQHNRNAIALIQELRQALAVAGKTEADGYFLPGISTVSEGVLGSAKSALATRPAPGCDGWRPIESAPRDGSYILVWNRKEAVVAYGYEHDGLTYWWDAYSQSVPVNATHWQPLPPAPRPADPDCVRSIEP